MSRAAEWETELQELESQGRRRRLPGLDAREGRWVFQAGRRLLNLSSNDYLGLAGDASLQRDFLEEQARREGPPLPFSASASRLLTGDHAAHRALEDWLAGWYGREAALVFNSGYHANTGLLGALADRQDVIFADRLCHASLLDGIRLSGARWFRYPHNDLRALETLLRKHRGGRRRAWLVSESVFSMDGDTADLAGLLRLRDAYDARLLLDEAHAVGVLGTEGRGLAEQERQLAGPDILVGTMGKALASLGAFAVMDRVIRDVLLNRMRPLIYTTALPPWQAAWSLFVLRNIPGLTDRRERLQRLSRRLRTAAAEAGFECPGYTPIVPLRLGTCQAAVAASDRLRDTGRLALPVRPPTVPEGTARLRLSLTADMAWEELADLPAVAARARATADPVPGGAACNPIG